jgi:transglutaminase-like putative cysteine protease
MASSRSSPPSNRPAPAAALLVAVAVGAAVFGVGLLGPSVPRDGVIDWRTPGGLGGGFFGSASYNPYVQIHKSLVSREGVPLFRARISGDIAPTDVSFRLLTLETYHNGQWSAYRPQVYRLDDPPLQEPGYEYFGPTESITADVEILALSQGWLPTPYAVTGAGGEDAEAFRIRRTDTAIHFKGDLTYRNMEYQVTADVPSVDPATIAGDPAGGYSPLFTAAVEGGESVPSIADVEVRELPDAERYLELPEDIDPRIYDRATALTERLTTPFEQGLAIEHWFRETGGFVYDLDSEQGHSDDLLASWLFDDSPENTGYRRGYCEQFATSMAVMTRSIGIPTRVVLGFTPGTRTGANEVVVLDENAHSWVELWIPAAGWVSFDPTPRADGANPATAYGNLADDLGFEIAAYLEQIPELVRAETIPNRNPIGGVPAPGEDRRDPGFIEPRSTGSTDSPLPEWPVVASLAIMLVAVFVTAVPIIKWTRHRSRMRRIDEGDVTAAWEEIVVRLTDFGDEPDPAATPLEVAEAVDEAMRPLASVYTRSVYGRTTRVSADNADAARRSMQITSDRLTTRHSPLERLRSRYRLRSLTRRFRS